MQPPPSLLKKRMRGAEFLQASVWASAGSDGSELTLVMYTLNIASSLAWARSKARTKRKWWEQTTRPGKFEVKSSFDSHRQLSCLLLSATMAPTPTKPARTERRIAQSSPYARPTAPLRTDASSSRVSILSTVPVSKFCNEFCCSKDAPSGLRGFFSRLWGGKHKSSQPQVEPDQSAEESAVRAQSEDSDLVLVDAGPGKTATTEPVTKNNAGPPLRLPNASGWNDPPSFSTQNINMSTPVKKSVSLFDLGRHQGSPAAVNDLAEYFKLKSQRGETLTAEEAANVVQLVSSGKCCLCSSGVIILTLVSVTQPSKYPSPTLPLICPLPLQSPLPR